MRVGFDSQIFRTQRLGGISRYFTEVMHEFRHAPDLDVDVVTPFRYIVNEHLLADEPGRYRRAFGPSMVSRALGRVLDPRVTDPLDIVHHTFYDPAFIGQMPTRVTVSTVHDMIPELYPDLFPGGDPHEGKRQYVGDSDLVICVSAATQKDLHDIYNTSTPTVVVPLAVRSDFAVGAVPTLGLLSPYVLHVGARGDHKGFDVLVEALALLGRDAPDLITAGGGPTTPRDTELFERFGIRGVHMRGSVSQARLAGLYAGSQCFVMASRAEGFGLPLLEAMASGTPVVASDLPVFHEVADEAASYFALGSAEDLARAIAQMSRGSMTSERREKIIQAGRMRAADFTWHRTAELTRAAYEQALS